MLDANGPRILQGAEPSLLSEAPCTAGDFVRGDDKGGHQGNENGREGKHSSFPSGAEPGTSRPNMLYPTMAQVSTVPLEGRRPRRSFRGRF